MKTAIFLLEICAVSDTFILDEKGIYNPSHFNDLLLLGLKGTMSEAQLHIIRAWLIGGMLDITTTIGVFPNVPYLEKVKLCFEARSSMVSVENG